MFDAGLLAKIVASGGIVLGLSLIAERVGPRIAGFLSGAPLGAVIVYFFLGLDAGPTVVIAGIPHAIAGLSGTLVFVLVYYRVSVSIRRFGIIYGPLAGIAAFFVVVLALSRVSFGYGSALAITGVTGIVVGAILRRRINENVSIGAGTPMTPRVVLFRVGLSTLFVVSVIFFGQILGPVWAGLLVGFPMTLLPLLLIIHQTHSRDHAHAIIRAFPIGMVALVIYLLSIPLTFAAFGVVSGTAASLCVSASYLIAVPVIWRMSDAKSADPCK